MSSSLRRLARTAAGLGPIDVALTVLAVVAATVVEVAIRVVPLRRLTRVLGIPLQRTGMGDVADEAASLTLAEKRRGRAVDRVMRRWPFGEGSCLRRSVLHAVMLRRHHPVLWLGVRADDAKILAHAWVELPGIGTIGADPRYQPFLQVNPAERA